MIWDPSLKSGVLQTVSFQAHNRNGNLRTGHYSKFGFSLLLHWAICKSLLWEAHFRILLFNVLPRDTATGKVLKWHEKLITLRCKFETWEHSTYLLFINIYIVICCQNWRKHRDSATSVSDYCFLASQSRIFDLKEELIPILSHHILLTLNIPRNCRWLCWTTLSKASTCGWEPFATILETKAS